MLAQNFNFALIRSPKWEIFCPKFCIFRKKNIFGQKVSKIMKFRGRSNPCPPCYDATAVGRNWSKSRVMRTRRDACSSSCSESVFTGRWRGRTDCKKS